MNGNITYINTDDPNAIASHVWTHTPAEATQTRYEGIDGQTTTVAVGEMEFAVGYDPREDGILWAINTIDSDGTREPLYFGGWAPGDRETAEREIAGIITTMNGGTVTEWQPSPEQAAQIAAIQQRNTEYMAALEGKK